MPRAERDKGARGEQEVATIFRGFGFECARTPNSGGLEVKGDLAGLPGVHVEVKRQETARPWAWWEQAAREAGQDAPVVAFRRNRSAWLALVGLEDLAALLAAVLLAPSAPRAALERDARLVIAGHFSGLPADVAAAGAAIVRLDRLLNDDAGARPYVYNRTPEPGWRGETAREVLERVDAALDGTSLGGAL